MAIVGTTGAIPTTTTAPTVGANGLPTGSWFNNFNMFSGDQAQALRDWSAAQGYTPAAPTQQESFGVLDSLYNDPAKIAATAPGVTAPEQGVDQGLHDAFQSLDNYRLTGFQDTLNQGGDPDAAYGTIQGINSDVAPQLDTMGQEIKRQRELYQDAELNKNDNDFMHKLVGGIGGAALGAATGGLTGGSFFGPAGDWLSMANSARQGAGAAGGSGGGAAPGQPQDWTGLAKSALDSAALRRSSSPAPTADPRPAAPMVQPNTPVTPQVTPGPVASPAMTQPSPPSGGAAKAGMMSNALRGRGGKHRWL